MKKPIDLRSHRPVTKVGSIALRWLDQLTAALDDEPWDYDFTDLRNAVMDMDGGLSESEVDAAISAAESEGMHDRVLSVLEAFPDSLRGFGKSKPVTVSKMFNVCVFGDRGIDDDYAVSDLAKEWGASSAQDNSFDFDSKRDAKGFAKEAENLPGVDRVEIINLETGEEASFDPKTKAALTPDDYYAQIREDLPDDADEAFTDWMKDDIDTDKVLAVLRALLTTEGGPGNDAILDAVEFIEDYDWRAAGRSTRPVRKSLPEPSDDLRQRLAQAADDAAEFASADSEFDAGEFGGGDDAKSQAQAFSEASEADTLEEMLEILEDAEQGGTVIQQFLGELRTALDGLGKSHRPVTKSLAPDLVSVVQVTESLASKVEMSRDVLLATAHDAMLAGDDYEEPVSLISELGQLASAIRYLAEDYERYAVAAGSPEAACVPYNPWPGSLRYPIDCCARMIGVLTGDPTYETVVATLIEVRDEMRTYCGEETGPVGVPNVCRDPW